MLNLTALNETITQKRKGYEIALLKKFFAFHDQVEQGITNIAEKGERMGEIVVVTEGLIKTHEIEELLRNHYHPISFTITHNQTHDNPKERIKSYFIVDVFIPSVEPNATYGCDIIEGI
jgi:hypothetical protein